MRKYLKMAELQNSESKVFKSQQKEKHNGKVVEIMFKFKKNNSQ